MRRRKNRRTRNFFEKIGQVEVFLKKRRLKMLKNVECH